MSQATPDHYSRAFSLTDGEIVLDDLMARFAKPPFVPGQPDATAYNCGTKAVLEHILAQIAAAEQRPEK